MGLIRSRIAAVAVIPILLVFVAACGGSEVPKVKSAEEAEQILRSDWGGGYRLDLDEVSSCDDANGNWIAGCQHLVYEVAGQANVGEVSEKGWTFWWTDAVRTDESGVSSDRWCYGIIPAYDRWPAQIFAAEGCE